MCQKVFIIFFFFCLDPDILPQFCPNLDFAIFRTQRLKEKENFIELKYSHHLRNIEKVIKDSTDHRVSFYHRFLNKII